MWGRREKVWGRREKMCKIWGEGVGESVGEGVRRCGDVCMWRCVEMCGDVWRCVEMCGDHSPGPTPKSEHMVCRMNSTRHSSGIRYP